VKENRQVRFISDVHLPPEGRHPAAARAPVFLDFLDQTAGLAEQGKCGTLCVLGDLFGFWYEAGGRPPRGYDRVLRAMREAASRGLRIVVLHGNRDFLLGPAFTKATGAHLAPDELEISLGGKRICLTHGDAFVWGDHRYQVWRRLSRGGSFRRVANGLPRWLAERVACAFRLGSEFEKSVKPRAAMAYAPGALRARVARGADVIVAGHVHEAGELTIEAAGREGRLLRLGSWDEGRGAYAEWTGEELRLVPG
jgi:UDP-2,3-diacylglucosamine hydrolase